MEDLKDTKMEFDIVRPLIVVSSSQAKDSHAVWGAERLPFRS